MTFDDHRRALVFGGAVDFAGRGIKQAVGVAPVAGHPADRLGPGQGRIGRQRVGGLQDLRRAVGVEQAHMLGPRRVGRDHSQRVVAGYDLFVEVEVLAQAAERARLAIHLADLPDAVVGGQRKQPPAGGERISRLAEHPLRDCEFGGLVGESREPAVRCLDVDIPPVVDIGHDMQHTVRIEHRAEQRNVIRLPERGRRADTALCVDVGSPQLGHVPRHMGMIPGQPDQALRARRQTRAGIEVMPLGQRVDPPVAVYGDHASHGLCGGLVRGFCNRDQPTEAAIVLQIGKAQIGAGIGNRGQLAFGVALPDRLVAGVDKPHEPTVGSDRPAAVFIDPAGHR